MNLFEALANMKDTMEGKKPPKKLKYSKKEIAEIKAQEPLSVNESVSLLGGVVKNNRFESEEYVLLKNPHPLISNVLLTTSKDGTKILEIEFLEALSNLTAKKYQPLDTVGEILKNWGVEKVPEKVKDIIDIIFGSTVKILKLSRDGNQHIVENFSVVGD